MNENEVMVTRKKFEIEYFIVKEELQKLTKFERILALERTP